jgi:hypothetical protein
MHLAARHFWVEDAPQIVFKSLTFSCSLTHARMQAYNHQRGLDMSVREHTGGVVAETLHTRPTTRRVTRK